MDEEEIKKNTVEQSCDVATLKGQCRETIKITMLYRDIFHILFSLPHKTLIIEWLHLHRHWRWSRIHNYREPEAKLVVVYYRMLCTV